MISVVQGLRAFLPKAELINRVNNYTELKENVRPITLSQFSSLLLHSVCLNFGVGVCLYYRNKICLVEGSNPLNHY